MTYLASFKWHDVVGADPIDWLRCRISGGIKGQSSFPRIQFDFCLLRLKIPLHGRRSVSVEFYGQDTIVLFSFHTFNLLTVVTFLSCAPISSSLTIYSVQRYCCIWHTHCQDPQWDDIEHCRFLPLSRREIMKVGFTLKKIVEFFPKGSLGFSLWMGWDWWGWDSGNFFSPAWKW